MTRYFSITLAIVAAIMMAGCQNDTSATPSNEPPTSSQGNDHGDDHAEGEHDEEGEHGHEGEMRELGSTAAGEWTVKASITAGDLTAGGEAVVDCEISGSSEPITAVRCWIGTQDAQGAIKALAEVEDADEPAHGHAHVEVPQPLADDSRLWIEVEDETGAKQTAGFDLK
jgi:hypothetical protein